MSGFPWTSLIIAVVPAAGVLAGAALTNRQNNQAGQTATLKADYAAFVQAVTVLLERPGEHSEVYEPPGNPGMAGLQQLVSAIALARAVVDLAGSFVARKTAAYVWRATLRAITVFDDWDPDDRRRCPSELTHGEWVDQELREALEDFVRAVRAEVGGESRPGLKWIINNWWRRRRRRYERPVEPADD